MTHDRWRQTDAVDVPNVVGELLSDARRMAHDAGVVLAQPDPDGPPLSALTWPGEYVVTAQSPPPGTRLWRWDSVVVRWTAPDNGDPTGVREPRRPRTPLDTIAAERDPDDD